MMRRSYLRSLLGTVCTAIMLSGACGCGTIQQTEPQTPSFSGPWAEDLSWNYQEAQKDGNVFAQNVLQDSTITDAEANEVADRKANCLADAGFKPDWVNPDGSSQFPESVDTSGEDYLQVSQQCAKESGSYYITALYNAIANDPNGNLRNMTAEERRNATFDCLRRNHVTDETSDSELRQELAKEGPRFVWIPMDASDPRYDATKVNNLIACQNNPLQQ